MSLPMKMNKDNVGETKDRCFGFAIGKASRGSGKNTRPRLGGVVRSSDH